MGFQEVCLMAREIFSPPPPPSLPDFPGDTAQPLQAAGGPALSTAPAKTGADSITSCRENF